MWGIIATWRMAVEGISEASHILQEKGDAGDAIETAIKAVEIFLIINQLVMEDFLMKKWK